VNIFVGNLAFTTTEQDLRQLFEPYGSVETIRIMTDRETGRSRGFGFVEMPDSRAAQTAIDALNGTSLAGRALTVNEARPREPRRERASRAGKPLMAVAAVPPQGTSNTWGGTAYPARKARDTMILIRSCETKRIGLK
jgi:RNA recognition motif-containing protein